MVDNTRVNELQEKLLQAMDILNAQALSGISFDKTITCTIEDDTHKKEGKYTVTDGTKSFTAYSTDTSYRINNTVYVTIPQGNYENQKIIIGKQADDTKEPFIFTTPFDTIFDMTDNVLVNKNTEGELVANNIKTQVVTICEQECNLYGFTRLGIKANFKSWISEAISGNYGLTIIFHVNPIEDIASSEILPETQSVQDENLTKYYYNFSNSDMYGNSYNYETDYEQQLVIPIDEINGTIKKITINFWQEANFKDIAGKPIPYSMGKGYVQNIDGELVLAENDVLLDPNLFVKDIYLCLGYDISIFDKDMVQIYTQQSETYKHSNSINDDGIEKNKKAIKVRWVHIDENGTPKDMTKAKEKENEVPYEIRWYRYEVGASATDPYCGPYWTQIKDASGFFYDFNPNVNLQQEKIKVIILYNSITPYRSNELVFQNEEVLPPSEEAYHIANALTITTDDDTNGNYMIYGQDNSIKDTEYGKKTRTLSVWFDVNSSGDLDDNEIIDDPNQAQNITWTFPAQNTMIELLDSPTRTILEEGEAIAYQINTCKPRYKINSYYSPNKSNNTITCEYLLNGRKYTTEKEFTFGPAGTMGTDQTLVIDFVGDVNAIDMSNVGSLYQLQVQLYDSQNIQQPIPDDEVIWEWYYNSAILGRDNVKFPCSIDAPNIDNNKIGFTPSEFEFGGLYIIQATVGDLTTYFPIPMQIGKYSYIKGPTQVIYQSNGEPTYSKEAYSLYEQGDKKVPSEDIHWDIICNDKEKQEGYIADIVNNKLQPLNIYVKDAPVYGVRASDVKDPDNSVLWIQPILVLQNKWPNGVINAWDGKSLEINKDTSTILAAAFSAGKKDENNTFTGVMMGDWKGQDVHGLMTEQTGIYGFQQGDMSYAFMENGTAFIGKSGYGRIYFNGEDATIESGKWKAHEVGMQIDLDQPSLIMKYQPEEGEEEKKDYSILLSAKEDKYPFKIGEKLKVQWDGSIEAEGTIYAEKGSIGNWTIEGGNIIGKPIKDAEEKIHNPMITLGEANQPTSIKLFSKIKYTVPNNYLVPIEDKYHRVTVTRLSDGYLYSFGRVSGTVTENNFVDNMYYIRLDPNQKGPSDKLDAYESYKNPHDVKIIYRDGLDDHEQSYWAYRYIKLYKGGPYAIRNNEGEIEIVEFNPAVHLSKYEAYYTNYGIMAYPFYKDEDSNQACIYMIEGDTSSNSRKILYDHRKGYEVVLYNDDNRPDREETKQYSILSDENTIVEKETAQIYLGREGMLCGTNFMMDGQLLLYDPAYTQETSDGGTLYNNLLGTIGYVSSNDGTSDNLVVNGIGMQTRSDSYLIGGYDIPTYFGGVFSIKVTNEHIGLSFKADEEVTYNGERFCGSAYITITKTGRISIYAEDGVFINNNRVEGT